MGTVHSGQLQDRYNMAKFLILSACLALSTAAPSQLLGALAPAGYAGFADPGAVVGQHVVPGPTHVQEHVHAGPAVAHHRTITGVVGHRQVQVGTQTVQVGHQYAQTGEVAAPPAANYGPAPADAVTTYAVDAPVRTHTRITPRLHRIEPELQVNKVPYDVPVAVPVPVERTVVHT